MAAVIAPWNFPFAIAMGMVSAAIVTGNPVVFKPSSLSSAIGYNLVEIFKEVGLPAGVFNYCPGQSSVMGDYLVEHPDISLICFTGSMDVGLHIVEKAAKVQPGQRQVKRVIAEMGGKNATIVDDDADLDEAVSQVVYSAFGFQGQKCSACSRVIVLDAIYDTFVQRLALAAQSLRIGPAENPENFLGPLADASLQKNVLEYIEIAEAEGKTLVKRSDLPDKGAYVPLLIVEDIMPEHRIAQEEVFGPVLAVMRAKDFDEALELALSTRFALTGPCSHAALKTSPRRAKSSGWATFISIRAVPARWWAVSPSAGSTCRASVRRRAARLPAPVHGPALCDGKYHPARLHAHRRRRRLGIAGKDAGVPMPPSGEYGHAPEWSRTTGSGGNASRNRAKGL